ncbi:MAG: MBL fold metallo-hydrolase RNA specificity domain-containing protein [Syntrophomonadaceae bacterium]|jgi:metallo-beta-lactamase family protein|nr:MBL fold metallo-hydrolase [Syntrophomonadaceae bacterium]
MKLSFLGAARTVTGSFFLVDTENSRFAVDCGMFQGPRALQERNFNDFPIEPESIDFLILTHAHIDHIGLVPKLCKKGFKGKIYCSHATEDLAGVLLPDSGHIQESEIDRKNRKNKRAGKPLLEPIYTAEDAVQCLDKFRSLNMDEIIELAPGVKVRLRNAGHILGACIVELWVQEKEKQWKLVFTGDLGTNDQPIIKNPTIIESADYVIMESTYGSRLHPEVSSRKDELKKVIDQAMSKGGNLIIPAFAVERTQDLLYDLYHLSTEGKLDSEIEIYIDSPLAIAATRIFQKHVDLYDDDARKILEDDKSHPLMLDQLKFSHTHLESMALNCKLGNMIVISASGMCEAGRIKHHLKNNIWRPESTVLFVGYQAKGTLGRKILDGDKLVTIHGEKIAVNAEIVNIESYSAHADQQGLLDWLRHFKSDLKGVFLVHGEEESQDVLGELIEAEFNVPVYIPEMGDEFILEEMETVPRVRHSMDLSKDQANRAEKAYLDLLLKLHDIYRDNVKDSNYQQILKMVERIQKTLD